MVTNKIQDQSHPQEKSDRATVERLLQEGISDVNLAELARLRIRYQNFPGARDIQGNLDKLLNEWGLTETELYTKTRQIHAEGKAYKRRGDTRQEDWT